MIFLDTQAAIYLAKSPKKIPRRTWDLLHREELYISPMTRLEFGILHGIGRIQADPQVLMALLQQDWHVLVEEEGWGRAAAIAQVFNWTRDPFDRLITAHAAAYGAPLLTSDGPIGDHYPLAFWDEPPAASASV